jgi:hypothetical protein
MHAVHYAWSSSVKCAECCSILFRNVIKKSDKSLSSYLSKYKVRIFCDPLFGNGWGGGAPDDCIQSYTCYMLLLSLKLKIVCVGEGVILYLGSYTGILGTN